MQLILAANTMEHPGFPGFLRDAAQRYPQAAFAVAGDLLNVFPEPGEDMRSSIFYELYGNLAVDELQRLHDCQFSDVADSPLVGPLREIFTPGGRTLQQGRALASRRYGRVFGEMRAALNGRSLYFVPGNMDYPGLAQLFAAASPHIHDLDERVAEVDGFFLGGAGGIPSTAQPFGAITPISPYEMTPAAYAAHLEKARGCDVLLTHLAPEESPELSAFVQNSGVRLVLCRAPFDLRQTDNCRGLSQVSRLGSATVLKIRPFDYPENATFLVELNAHDGLPPHVEIFTWRAPGVHEEVRISA